MEKKEKSMIDNHITEVIDKLSISSKYKILGSNSLKGMLYGADIDIFSDIGETTKEEAIHKHFVNLFKSNDYTDKRFLFMDFKCGLDTRLVFNDGDNVNKYLKNDLIPASYKKRILKATGDDRLKLIRDLFVLRWTPNEVIRGYKMLIDGSKKHFTDALLDDTIIKLDVCVIVGVSLIDLTEVYQYRQSSASKKDIEADLSNEINKYHMKNTMKSLKRLYSYLRLKNTKKKLQQELIDLFNSPLGFTNKLVNDIVYCVEVCEKHSLDWKLILDIIQQFKDKYFKLGFSNDKYAKRLDKATRSNYLKVLSELAEVIRKELNVLVKEEFKKMKHK